MQVREFKWRSFVSFGMFFSFLIMAVSGIVLYVAPPGRVFRWTNWHLLGIDLSQWQALHTLFSYLFIGFAISHIFSMNWKILFSYFTRKTREGLRRKRELIGASLVILLFVAGTLFNVPPFSSVMQLGSWSSDTWGKNIDYPPVAHAEAMSLEEIALVLLDLEAEEYLERIRQAGYQVEGVQQKLGDVSALNGVAPYVFFRNTTRGLKVLVLPAAKD
ncbi:MAG: DUF4405 domain-containing protein [Prolixibacteraceae bacterium]|nr:DUF4405 domain-containing protein [Prolixibacteraceae bacterium]